MAIDRIKKAVAKTYGRRGKEVVEKNQAAVDRALEGMHRVEVPGKVTATRELPRIVPDGVPEFVRTVTAEMMAGRGEGLPVSALPVDGTYPSGTAAYEKRNISEFIARWEPETCIQCGNCSFVCPHSVIRSRQYDKSHLKGAPDGFRSAPLDAVGLPDARYTLQVYVEDCTGCGLCVEACPVETPGDPVRKAINLTERAAARRGRAGEHRLLRDPAGDRPVPGRLRHGARHAVPRAAVRVLGGLRGLRRDALPQAALAAVRRPADGRQRDRLLVDLRRQPADDAVDDATPTGAGRPGRTRCSRTTPSSGSASGWRPTRTPSSPGGASPSCATRSAPSSSTRFSARRSCGSRSCAPSANGWPS